MRGDAVAMVITCAVRQGCHLYAWETGGTPAAVLAEYLDAITDTPIPVTVRNLDEEGTP